ncbi:MAG: hypothetical protein LBU11_08405 [Zoogloeaceae bacterium]|jgi:hypothetical protein|nr:hypothetical protein [Zoogloeaceae bacterium]
MSVIAGELYQRYPLNVVNRMTEGEGFVQALARALPKGWINGNGNVAAAMYRGHQNAAAVRLNVKSEKLARDIPGSRRYSHPVSQGALTHIRNEHGDRNVETSRGQISINEADIAAIPSIVENYDNIRTDLASDRGNPVVAYVKRVNDGVVLYLEELGRKRMDFTALSMRKYPAGTDSNKVLSLASTGRNVRNDGGHALTLAETGNERNKTKARTDAGLPTDALRTLSVHDEELNQSAWHGSGKDFDAFSLAFMGTGEGHQAFGWGAYFAGLRELGEAYRRQVASSPLNQPEVPRVKYNGEEIGLFSHGVWTNLKTGEKYSRYSPEAYAFGKIYSVPTVQDAINYLQEAIDSPFRDDNQITNKIVEDFRKAIDILRSGKVSKKEGQLYEVNIPEDEDLLDWDRPLSQQPEKVKEIILEYGIDRVDDALNQVMREVNALAETMENAGLDNAASLLIKEANRALESESPTDMEIAIGRADSALDEDIAGDAYDDLQDTIWGLLDKIRDVSAGSFFNGVTGQELYRNLSRARSSDQAASEYLKSIGIPGHRYLDGQSRSAGEGSHNYVIYDEKAIEILKKYYQEKGNDTRGSFNPQTLTISLFEQADLSTFLHESGHFYLEAFTRIAGEIGEKGNRGETLTGGETGVLRDMDSILGWFGLRDIGEWSALTLEERRACHEQFARGFESYLFGGKSPNLEMNGVFARFRAWLLKLYESVKSLNVKLTPEVRSVFDRMLASEEEIALAEQGRGLTPLFETAEQAGETAEEFAAFQEQGRIPTEEAIADLQARGLRDLQWLANAKGRVLKELQKRARVLRREARTDATHQIMQDPLYRAWAFLTNRMSAEDKLPPLVTREKRNPDEVEETRDSLFAAIAKLGGLDAAELSSRWGYDPKEKIPQTGFGKRVVLKNGAGRTIAEMAEALGQYGYLARDENDRFEEADFEARFFEELRGQKQHSMYYDPENDIQRMLGEQVANPETLGAGRLDEQSLKEMFGESQYALRRFASTFQNAREKAAEFAGRGKPLLKNAQTGMEARVSRNNLDKMLSKSAVERSVSPEIHSLAVANLDRIFEIARSGKVHPDRAQDENITAVHCFYAPLVTTDGVYKVKLTVKEFARETNGIYSVEALEIENAIESMKPGEPEGVGGQETLPRPPVDGAMESIDQWLAQVKAEVEGGAYIAALLKSHGMTARNGLHPDLAASLFADENLDPVFASGEDMIRQLAAATPLDDAINERTDSLMLQRHGELSTPEAIEEAANRAIHNDVRARWRARCRGGAAV